MLSWFFIFFSYVFLFTLRDWLISFFLTFLLLHFDCTGPLACQGKSSDIIFDTLFYSLDVMYQAGWVLLGQREKGYLGIRMEIISVLFFCIAWLPSVCTMTLCRIATCFMSRVLCIAKQNGPEIALLGVFSALVTHNGVVWHISIHIAFNYIPC